MSSNPEPNNFSRLLVTGLTLLIVATIYMLSDGEPPNIVSQRDSFLKQRYVRAKRIARRRLWDQDTSDPGIPRNLIFTYRNNILDTKEPKILYDNVQHTIKAYAEAWGETDPKVIFLSDDKCAKLLSEIMPLLAPYYLEEYRGGHRGDICRIVSLYYYGGYYFDVDIEVADPVLPSSDISLITIESPNRQRFFQSFLAAKKGHPAFHKAFNMMLEYYSRGQDNSELMGDLTRTLHLAYNSLTEEQREDTLILDEINLWGRFGQKFYPGCKSLENCPHQFVVHNPKENRIYFHSHIAEAGLLKNSTNTDAGLASQDVSGPKIPHNMIFTYKDNLFETKDPEILFNNVQHTIEAYSQAWGEPNPRIMFLTDYECGKIITEFTPELAPYFCNEPYGAFRGDICRTVALYIYGGYYFDVDIEVIEPVILSPNIAFSTVDTRSHKFFQAFLASQKGHPVLQKAFDTMLEYYKLGIRKSQFMGPKTLTAAYDSTPEDQRGDVYILQETNLWDTYPDIPKECPRSGCGNDFAVHDPNERRIYFHSRIAGAIEHSQKTSGVPSNEKISDICSTHRTD